MASNKGKVIDWIDTNPIGRQEDAIQKIVCSNPNAGKDFFARRNLYYSVLVSVKYHHLAVEFVHVIRARSL